MRSIPQRSSRPGRCGNALAVVNAGQIIVAADVTNQTHDVQQAVPMLDQTLEDLEAVGVAEQPQEFVADASD